MTPMVALNIYAWAVLILFGILNLILIELVKWIYIRKTKLALN